ncbi:hypothetical protein [Paenibacillus validus]|uniref:hypothetical protein n=1 Tax=Paenibacillus validus TaxID=44253 RepID=UPI003D29658D
MKVTKKIDNQIIVDVFSFCKEFLLQQDENITNKQIPRLNYTLDQLEEVIDKYSKKKSKVTGTSKKDPDTNKLSEEIEKIKDQNALRSYYNNSLRHYFDTNSTEEMKNAILKSVSLNDLRYLYSLISPITLPQSRKKTEILQLLRMYFENESRTRSLKI